MDQKIELWGDGHTHSDWGDGFSSLNVNSERLVQYGQDFHFACDHLLVNVSPPAVGELDSALSQKSALFPMDRESIATYQEEVRASSTPEHTALDGLELTWQASNPDIFGATNRHHVIVRDNLCNVPPASSFRGASFASILSQLKDRGMRPFLAHINDAVPPDCLTGDEISGIEVRSDIERRESPLDLAGIATWDRWLSHGHRVALSAGSDAHQMDLWAGSGARNVVRSSSADPADIRAAVLNGQSYVSATWHADVYADLGYPSVVPGSGSFTPWWMLNGRTSSRPSRDQVRDEVDRLIEATLSAEGARAGRRHFPTMSVNVEGAAFGEEAEAKDNLLVGFRFQMHVPIVSIRIWSDGALVHRIQGDGRTTVMEGEVRLNLAHSRYLRLDVEGRDEQQHTEYLMSNPIYLVH